MRQRNRPSFGRAALCVLLSAVWLAIVPCVVRGATAAPGDRLIATYQVRPAGDQGVTSEGLAALQLAIQQRLDAYGITDANAQVVGTNQITVDIPNSDDASRAIVQVGQVGLCEFVGSDTPLAIGSTITTSLGGPIADTTQPNMTATATADDMVYSTILQGTDIATAAVQTDPATTPVPTITFTLRDTAAQTFSDYTGTHTGQYISIIVDKRVVSSAMVVDRISGNVAALQGIDLRTMRALAAFIRSGPLIIPLAVSDTHIAAAAV